MDSRVGPEPGRSALTQPWHPGPSAGPRHARLKARGVTVPEQVEYSEAYRVTHFFFHDPAGYLLEVQRFERPDWPDPAP